ncbi:MAG: cytochrome P460 family protein, partial [Candidatus Acidiferrales bacterium]
MTRIAFLLAAVVAVAGVVASIVPAARPADEQASPAYVTKMPSGYRDWRFISTAHEAGKFNSIGVLLGNDVAIKAYREGTLPYPDGTMLVAL